MYTPSGRTDLWIKIKPDYFDELGENADLLVLGGGSAPA
jgi:ATP-dependent DNA ligase